MEVYQTVYESANAEIIEKKSRFIADIFPVCSEEEAAVRIESIRKRYWDARHHCWAYVIGEGQVTERFSDDGEPGGTAGKPILEVLRGRELHNVLAVVTRYFGGTLLGTGGLVRAYSQACREGLAHSTIISKINGFKLKIRIDYTQYGKIQYILGQNKVPILDTAYTEQVDLTVLASRQEERKIRAEITQETNGKACIERVQECWFADVNGSIVVF